MKKKLYNIIENVITIVIVVLLLWVIMWWWPGLATGADVPPQMDDVCIYRESGEIQDVVYHTTEEFAEITAHVNQSNFYLCLDDCTDLEHICRQRCYNLHSE